MRCTSGECNLQVDGVWSVNFSWNLELGEHWRCWRTYKTRTCGRIDGVIVDMGPFGLQVKVGDVDNEEKIATQEDT